MLVPQSEARRNTAEVGAEYDEQIEARRMGHRARSSAGHGVRSDGRTRRRVAGDRSSDRHGTRRNVSPQRNRMSRVRANAPRARDAETGFRAIDAVMRLEKLKAES